MDEVIDVVWMISGFVGDGDGESVKRIVGTMEGAVVVHSVQDLLV